MIPKSSLWAILFLRSLVSNNQSYQAVSSSYECVRKVRFFYLDRNFVLRAFFFPSSFSFFLQGTESLLLFCLASRSDTKLLLHGRTQVRSRQRLTTQNAFSPSPHTSSAGSPTLSLPLSPSLATLLKPWYTCVRRILFDFRFQKTEKGGSKYSG